MTEINIPTLRQRERAAHVMTETEIYANAMTKKAEQERKEANDAAREMMRQQSRRSVGGVR